MSHDHQLQPGSDSPEIVGVAGDDGLPSPLRANDDVGIDNPLGNRQETFRNAFGLQAKGHFGALAFITGQCSEWGTRGG